MDRESQGLGEEVSRFDLGDEEVVMGEAAVEIENLEERLAMEEDPVKQEELRTQIEALRNSLESVH